MIMISAMEKNKSREGRQVWVDHTLSRERENLTEREHSRKTQRKEVSREGIWKQREQWEEHDWCPP